MTAMDYRPLGTTGLQVSRIALGCGNFGGIGSAPAFYGQGETEEEAFAIMDAALEAGINVFDTANAYGGGRSETAIGRWLAKRGSAVRDQVLLSTKAFNPVGDGPNDRGLSRRALFRAVDASLDRLGAERIDLFLCHEPDPGTPLEETLGALDDLRRAGKLHYIGASNIEAWRLARGLWISDVRGLARFEWVQSGYSLLDRSPEAEVLPLCAELGLGFSPFSPLSGGWLTGKYRREQAPPVGSRMTLRSEPYEHLLRPAVFDALEGLEARANERGVAMPTLSLAWLLADPLINPVVVGPRNAAHLEPALAALELHLDAAERNELSALFPPSLGVVS
jgi:1-deoxyxylulose-5-phosphate synthase